MPIPRIVVSHLLDDVDQNFVNRLSLTICLWKVRLGLHEFDVVLVREILDFFGNKRIASICCDCLWDSKPVNDLLFEESDHCS